MGDYFLVQEEGLNSTKDSLKSIDNSNSSTPKETSNSTTNTAFTNSSNSLIFLSLNITYITTKLSSQSTSNSAFSLINILILNPMIS